MGLDEEAGAIFIPFVHMRKLRHTKQKWLDHGPEPRRPDLNVPTWQSNSNSNGALQKSISPSWEGQGCFPEEAKPELTHGGVSSEQAGGGRKERVLLVYLAEVKAWQV